MLPGGKHLSNLMTNTGNNLTDTFSSVSFNKTQKLITALYMVTDIMDSEEPIRHKLRDLGSEIISDMYIVQSNLSGHTEPRNLYDRISEIVSFLDIASAMSFISEMNYSILKKEFKELKRQMEEYIGTKNSWLTGFISEDRYIRQESGLSNGHIKRINLGVQKGSTLMKALSDKNFTKKTNKFSVSNTVENNQNKLNSNKKSLDFAVLKKQRRDNIMDIIRNNGGDSSIKDIREKINIGVTDDMICSEKTLQRELVSMVKDGVLNKAGEKRWTQYSIKK